MASNQSDVKGTQYLAPVPSRPSGITRPLRWLVGFVLRALHLYVFYALRTRGYLHDMGWFRSYYEKTPVDRNGEPIPWLTYPAISFLEKRVTKEMTVFEYGAGNSSLWWSRRVGKVITCEHDKAWFEKISRVSPENLEIHHIPLEYGGAYCRKVGEYPATFDIVVIDGRDRVNCAKNCIPALKENGIVVWDNADRQEYEDGYKFLASKNFRRVDFIGMVPMTEVIASTSVFYRSNNCLGI